MDFTSTRPCCSKIRLLSLSLFLVSAVLPTKAQNTTQQPTSEPPAQSTQVPYNFPALTYPAMAIPGSSSLETDISSPPLQDRAANTPLPQTTPRPPLPPSPPTPFQNLVRQTIGRNLPVFGANLFDTNTPSTFAPADNVPVTPDYVIGPGDEIRLQIWGQVNQRGTFLVDRSGSISIPRVGTIHLAGLQYSRLNDFLKSQLSRVYRNFDLSVNMGQLRSIQVFVVGRARQPGNYTISSLSTLLNAVFASGGPLPQGTLRDIQVKRGGQTITHFDLYDLLLHGDKSKDIQLLSGDVVFIPEAGPQVAILGSVNNPAIYELRDEKTFQQVLALAGGLSSSAAGSPLRVQRIDNQTDRSIVNVDLSASGSEMVRDGDIIDVTSIVNRFQNAVTLRGNVANPGRYLWREGMRISDLIPDKNALITRSYYERLTQLGQTIPDYLGPTNPAESAAQQELGQPRTTSAEQNSMQTPGGVNYVTAPAREGALQIQSATGTAANRQDVATGSGGSSIGAAVTTGSTTFTPRNDVVLSAPDIDWQYAVIERQNASDLSTKLLPFNLGKAVLEKDPSQDLQLLPGDVVTVFSKADIRVPSEQQTKFVRLEGEFAAAGVYSVAPGETLRQLLDRVGGLTPQADLFASEFTRESVRRIQKQRLLEYADQLEAQISTTTSASAAGALNERDVAAAQASAASARQVVTRLREAEPSGRIVLQLKPDSQGVNALPDMQLQDGDRFIVPRTPSTVSVQGQVYNANSFLYERGKRVRDYLRLAGGPDRTGDRKREFVLRADGSVISRQYGTSFGQHALFANRTFDEIVLYPGDTLIVPPIIPKTALLRELSDISTVFGGFGLGIAAINTLK